MAPMPFRLEPTTPRCLPGNLGIGLLVYPFVVAALATPLSAQIVTGRVVDASTMQPVSGAFVRIAGQASPPSETISARDGRFSLSAAPAAPFTLMVDMIGREPWVSDRHTLAAGDTLKLDVRLEVQVIALADLVARGDPRCKGIEREAALHLQSLWRNVTAALENERVARVAQPLKFTFELYQRDVTNDSMVIVKDQRETHEGTALTAFGSASIDHLESEGFFQPTDQGGTLLGPTAPTLLDPWFLDTHCIQVTARDDRVGEIGIAFAPSRDRSVTEIEGTIWLDSASFDLNEIDFRFTNVPSRILPDRYSGSSRFKRLPNGALVLSEWVMRSPMLQMIRRSAATLVGMHEVGGSVLRVQQGDLTLLESSRGSVSGIVYDSDGQPMPGADVFLRGTGFETVSDSVGNYLIAGVPEGTYVIGYEHPRLSQAGVALAVHRVDVAPGALMTIDLHSRSR